MKTLDIYNKCIPSCINMIGDTILDIINCIEKNYGTINESALFDLRVVLNEIMLNAVKHGNGGDEHKHVRVHAGVSSKGYAMIAVEDEGRGYSYDSLCKGLGTTGQDRNICSFEESGRGIMIVNSLCDRVKVNARGNRILIMKKLNDM